MNIKQFLNACSLIFLLLGIWHVVRIIGGWEVVVGSLVVTTGPSWLFAGAFLFMSLLGFYFSYKLRKEKEKI